METKERTVTNVGAVAGTAQLAAQTAAMDARRAGKDEMECKDIFDRTYAAVVAEHN